MCRTLCPKIKNFKNESFHMVGRKSGGISTIAVRTAAIEVQDISIPDASEIVAAAIPYIKKWLAEGNFHRMNAADRELFEIVKEKVCTNRMVRAMRINARPDVDNIISQNEAAGIIFKAMKSWNRWETGAMEMSLGDIILFLLLTHQMKLSQE